MIFLIQLIDLRPLEIAARDDAPDPSIFDDRKMTEAAIAHRPQRVDCAAIGSDRDWIRRHRLRQGGHCGILAIGNNTHRIAAGEDAAQALLVVELHASGIWPASTEMSALGSLADVGATMSFVR